MRTALLRIALGAGTTGVREPCECRCECAAPVQPPCFNIDPGIVQPYQGAPLVWTDAGLNIDPDAGLIFVPGWSPVRANYPQEGW